MFGRKFLVALALLGFQREAFAGPEMCKIAEAAISSASEIRGLKMKKEVPCYVHGKEDVKKYLLSVINEDLPPNKLQNEGVLYEALGFVPEGFDYEKGIVDLYLGQIGGYYDPKKDHFVMADWIPDILQTTVAVHEQTHALQDQYFELKDFIDNKSSNSDRLLARSALVEGDATAVMLDYTRKITGQPLIQNDKDVQSIMMQNLMGASLTAALGKIPSGLQMLLMFPYTSGLRFAHHLLVKGGYPEISKAFTSPPRSTEEILHPEKFFIKKQDFEEIESQSVLSGYKVQSDALLYEDTLGEFAISALLGTHDPDKGKVADASAGWGGDRVVVFKTSDTERMVVWKTLWDSEKDAVEFFERYQANLPTIFAALKDKDFVGGFQKASANKEVRLSRDGKAVLYELKISG